MSSLDILNLLLIFGFLIIITCVALITFFLIKALKSITNLTTSLENTSQNIRNGMQMKALAAVPAILVALVSKFLRRGR